MHVKDAVIGFVVGDALGVPVEFQSREYLKENPVVDMIGYGTYNMPQGTFSDDTSMTLAMMTSILNNNGVIVYDDIMNEFIEWYDNSKYTQYNHTFDIGNTTSFALNNYKNGIPPLESGLSGEHDNGNGSLMRVLPLAFIEGIDRKTIENVSSLTHAHIKSKIACVFYVELLKSIIRNEVSIKEHTKIASDKIKNYYRNFEELKNFDRILNGTIFNYDVESISSSAYVLTTLEAVIYVLGNTNGYKEAVLTAVNLGGDTDTIGAITGGVAGLYWGFW